MEKLIIPGEFVESDDVVVVEHPLDSSLVSSLKAWVKGKVEVDSFPLDDYEVIIPEAEFFTHLQKPLAFLKETFQMLLMEVLIHREQYLVCMRAVHSIFLFRKFERYFSRSLGHCAIFLSAAYTSAEIFLFLFRLWAKALEVEFIIDPGWDSIMLFRWYLKVDRERYGSCPRNCFFYEDMVTALWEKWDSPISLLRFIDT